MSSTSPEAKQAAVWAGWPSGSDGHRPYCEGYDAATAKLREELAQTNALLGTQIERIAAMKLAHQQPSPPSDGLAVASATTPDVEKIARELLDRWYQCDGEPLDNACKALAQARAPLVAALRDIQGDILALLDADKNSVLHKEAPLRIKYKVNDALRAALTGTEEK